MPSNASPCKIAGLQENPGQANVCITSFKAVSTVSDRCLCIRYLLLGVDRIPIELQISDRCLGIAQLLLLGVHVKPLCCRDRPTCHVII